MHNCGDYVWAMNSEMLSAMHSHNISRAFCPIASLALELQVLHDMQIPEFACLNINTIFYALIASLDHQKHKQYWF
jgi:hypothetical protein